MESMFLNPDFGRADLSQLLGDIQTQEKQKLHLVLFPFTPNLDILMVKTKNFNLLNNVSFFRRLLQYKY